MTSIRRMFLSIIFLFFGFTWANYGQVARDYIRLGSRVVAIEYGKPPVITSVTASAAYGMALTVDIVVTKDSGGNQNGATNISIVNLLINTFLDGSHACYLAFVRSGTNAGTVLLVNDAGSSGGPFQSMNLPSTNSVVSNSQCSIFSASSSVIESGDTLTLHLYMTFTNDFKGSYHNGVLVTSESDGSKVLYAAVRDASSLNSGWNAGATFFVSTSAPTFGVDPRTGVGFGPQYVSFTFHHPTGWSYGNPISNVLLNQFLDGGSACYFAIVPIPANPNPPFVVYAYLLNDAGDGFSGVIAVPGTGSTSNSQCTIQANTASSISTFGNATYLALNNLSLTFTGSFAGNRIFYLAAYDTSYNSGWIAEGSRRIP